MVERGKTARNVAIIVLLALVVWLVPGGGTGAVTVSNVLSVILFAGLAFFAYRMYMEHRIAIMDMPDRTRTTLYISVAVLLFALVATSRAWNGGGPLILLWFAVIGAAIYGLVAVFRWTREY